MKKLTLLIFCIVLLTPFMFSADRDSYDSNESYNDGPRSYDDAKVLRVKYIDGEAYVKRSYDDGEEEVVTNLPIFEKDTAGTTDGRLEIYMGRLNYLRFDYDTEVVFDKVPELRQTEMALRILHGGIYLDLENLDNEKDIEIQTPDCGVFILTKGIYRINVTANGRTEVFVIEGRAEVAGENMSKKVRESQRMTMANGEISERPNYYNTADLDEFDEWNTDRDHSLTYARTSTSRYLEDGYQDYEYELTRNGNWSYDSNLRVNVWAPYNVASDWMPYQNGRWVWNPYYGYVWSSYDPWGYFTYHYGRWNWDPYRRWYWVPSYRWSPAWVSWFWDDDYCGWSPWSWYNRPVIVINGRWDHHYHYHKHGIPVHSHSTIILKKHDVFSHNVRNNFFKFNNRDVIGKKFITFKGTSPNFKYSPKKIAVFNAKGKTVYYNENSLTPFSKLKQRVITPGKTTPGSRIITNNSDNRKGISNVFKYTGNDNGDKGSTNPPKKGFKFGGYSNNSNYSNTDNSNTSDNNEPKRGNSFRIYRNNDDGNNDNKGNDSNKTSGTSGGYKIYKRGNDSGNDNGNSGNTSSSSSRDTSKDLNIKNNKTEDEPSSFRIYKRNSDDSNSSSKDKGKTTTDSSPRYIGPRKIENNSSNSNNSPAKIDRPEPRVIIKKKDEPDGPSYSSRSYRSSESDSYGSTSNDSSYKSRSSYRYKSSGDYDNSESYSSRSRSNDDRSYSPSNRSTERRYSVREAEQSYSPRSSYRSSSSYSNSGDSSSFSSRGHSSSSPSSFRSSSSGSSFRNSSNSSSGSSSPFRISSGSSSHSSSGSRSSSSGSGSPFKKRD